nr:CONSTANS-like 3B [Mangifera indica]
MYTFPRASDVYGTNSSSVSSDDPSHFPLAPLPSPHLLDHATGCTYEVDSVMVHSHSSSTSSGCSSYSSPSYGTTSQIQRSISSHSLQKNNNRIQSLFLSPNDHSVEMDTSPVRRVFSTGDLHKIHTGRQGHRSESPLISESCAIIEGMNRACRYSPEEKKERIERYRTKRTQRNFNKKIKYACRKTLADSRPRIRGRFARNEEIEKNPQTQWSHISEEEDDEEEENWINYIDSVSSANLF